MPWHIYHYRNALDGKGGATPNALVVFIYDDTKTTRAVAETWARHLPDIQFSFLAIGTGSPVPDENALEKLATLINWELIWTGLWYYERAILIGVGRGSHIALRLASKFSFCAGVVACATEFSIGDPAGALTRIPVRLIRYAHREGIQTVRPIECAIRGLRRQNTDFEAVTVDVPFVDAENAAVRLAGNYLNDLLPAAAAAGPEKARGWLSA
jgi:hypothetical protein